MGNTAQVQLQRLEQVQVEHGDLAARFKAAVTEARQTAGAEGLLAEGRAGGLEQALAQREAELKAALAAAGPAGSASAKAAGQQCEKVSEAACERCCGPCMAVMLARHEHRGMWMQGKHSICTTRCLWPKRGWGCDGLMHMQLLTKAQEL